MNLTIGAWMAWFICTLIAVALGYTFGYMVDDTSYKYNSNKGKIIGTLISFVICMLVLFLLNWYYTYTAEGAIAFKTQQSSLENGTHRTIDVYDIDGDLIKHYEGKFDITYDGDRILFDDAHGLRHIIYYRTGIIIVDETKFIETEGE